MTTCNPFSTAEPSADEIKLAEKSVRRCWRDAIGTVGAVLLADPDEIRGTVTDAELEHLQILIGEARKLFLTEAKE